MAKAEHILVVNAGSSSIKFAIFSAQLDHLIAGELEGIGNDAHLVATDALSNVLVDRKYDSKTATVHDLLTDMTRWIESHLGPGTLAAIGHRIATGGLSHSAPVIITPEVLERLEGLIELAPLHMPRNLEPIESYSRLHPGLPQVACFDTAFHSTIPRTTALYGLPRHLADAGALRFGYHGISYEYVASQLATLDAKAARGRTVVAHLGSGSSMCALNAGRSVATTMGFSPLSGLVMATRPGELDAGLLIWLIREKGMSVDDVEHMLYHQSGLAGVSGLTGDMRELLASRSPEAREAIELFIHRISIELGSLCAALGGLDALVFTGGIGEHAATIRKAVCERAAWLGVELDREKNEIGKKRISTDKSSIGVWVVPTDEERMLAIHTSRLIGHDIALSTGGRHG